MGFGKVGSEVARRAKGLGMNVIAHDPYAPADSARAIGVDLVSFDEAISTAYFISLHMPLTPATSKIFNDETFSKMKKGARIINVARGGVIDEDALVRALDSGTVAQVCSSRFNSYFFWFYRLDFPYINLSDVTVKVGLAFSLYPCQLQKVLLRVCFPLLAILFCMTLIQTPVLRSTTQPCFYPGMQQAALDVFTEEPPPKDSKLVQHENVIVTPHLGASTKEAQV